MQVHRSQKVTSWADRVIMKALGTLTLISQGGEYGSSDVML